MSDSYVYKLHYTDFADEENFNISYSTTDKWPNKKVYLQFSESSRKKCNDKAIEYLKNHAREWFEVEEKVDGYKKVGI